ncbi:MAG TPA: type II restriction endonuclease, partial [Ignavibacteria bacterium]|nr:type II restriction endonuclease [Ignavibacteria bacterium]
MVIKILKPRKALNKAFLKVKPNRSEIDNFKTNLIQLLDRTNDTESEEFHKNLVSDFLKKTCYEPNHFINTKGRNDLVIHNGDKAKSSVGVIIEAKKPTNKSEMLTKDNVNVKAFQELVLYYLRERITEKNLEIKYLIATNINEWFIFDSNLFEKLFAQNKVFVKQFNDFENGRLSGKKTDFYYNEIAKPFISALSHDIEFTYFDIRQYEEPLRNDDRKDDNKLIALFKLISPEHLLKLPFANDSNSLDKRFYGELLHIIGLTETKQGGKKLIERNKDGERNTGSLLENTIIQLDSLDIISRLDNPNHFGATQQERLFNVGLELNITWLNRILFLKLLEAQLITYHKGDKSFAFLSLNRIQNYDDLNSLFFQVLARQQTERNEDVKKAFEKVPYLNSSLFEPAEIEHATLFISNLSDDKTIPIYSSTVLKNEKGKKRTGELSTLEYLFEFLDAYDFSSEGSEDIQEDNKALINASVLGLIFEKINGYKDGSFFTPGFITMYMSNETIRKAVVQKFNEIKKWNCKDIDSLYDKIENRQEANDIINSLKICDPAVGSGHFLVSSLNEIIAVKNDLKILQDRNGRRLKEYQVEVVNDDLIITDEDGELFEYNSNNKESQRIQETLFHEKQTIIENCLFGVDINPNSVKICRLRLWIELLKNAYYKNETELETLPNIDINIKCGNSLISRFEIDADLGKALKKSKWTIDSYRLAVDSYRNAQTKEQKHAMEKLINDIKSDFKSEISLNDPKVKRLRKLSGKIFSMTNQTRMFELSKKEKVLWNKKLKKLTDDSQKLETEIEEIK